MKHTPTLPVLLAASCVAALATGCATPEKKLQEQGLAPLTAEQIVQQHSYDRTSTFSSTTGSSGQATFTADGRIMVTWADGSDEGTWRIKGDQMCMTFKVIRGGAERCNKIYQTADNEYVQILDNGTIASTYSFTN
ncbi:MAG: hypothetical protein ACK4KV_20060 [Rhodocyclaceae bacterium]